MRVRPDVPPDLLGVVDALGLHQQIHEALVFTPAWKIVRNVGARKFVEYFAAIRFQARVHAQPERRVGGERQNVRQEIPRRVHQMNGRFAILDAHMHVQSENQIGPGHNLHVFHNVQIALVGVNLLLAPVPEWMRAPGGQTQLAVLGQLYHVPPQPNQLAARLLDVITNAGADLDHRLVHLRFYGFLQEHLALGDDLHIDMRTQIARFRIDGLIFFFDTDSEAGFHAITLWGGRPRPRRTPWSGSVIACDWRPAWASTADQGGPPHVVDFILLLRRLWALASRNLPSAALPSRADLPGLAQWPDRLLHPRSTQSFPAPPNGNRRPAPDS